MTHCRCVTVGSELIFGFKRDNTKTFPAQAARVREMNSVELLAASKEDGNFAFKLTPSEFAILPAGFGYMYFNLVATDGLLWAVSPKLPDEDARVIKLLAELLESTPVLREGPSQKLFDQFQSSLASANTPA